MLVLQFEKDSNPNYEEKIYRVGDYPSYGYDIESVDKIGNPKHIEVKTCSNGSIDKIDFYLTVNELEKLESDQFYCIYYVCKNENNENTILKLTRDDLNNLEKVPVAYKITAKGGVK